MNKKDMLLKFNHAFMAYKDFLYNYYNEELYYENNINTLICLFSSLSFMLNIDSIKTKDESPDEYINPDILREILNVITEKKGENYYIDNIFISNYPEEVLKVLRNKIAHGEFIIDDKDNKIVISYNDSDLKIDINAFISFIIFIIGRTSLYTNSRNYKRNNLYANTTSIKPIKSINDIDHLLQEIYFIEYNFSNVNPYDKEKIEILLKELPSFLVEYERVHNKKIDENVIISFFASNNIKVSPKIVSIYDSKYYHIIKDFILENLKDIISLNLVSQVSLISNWFYKVDRNQNPKENLKEGIHYNTRLLNILKTKHYRSIEQALLDSESPGLQSSLIEMIITNDLLGFYVHYQYPLENLCHEKDDIEDVYFDCSLLDLKLFQPAVFIPPEGQKISYEQSIKGAERRLRDINRKLNSATTQQNNLYKILETSTNMLQKRNAKIALRNIGEQIGILINKQFEELGALQILEKHAKEYTITDKEGYRYNRYLIEYMRNAIAHGHVYFDYTKSKGNSQNCQIRFLNIHNNQELFDLTISLKDFETLFNYQNMQVFNTYLQALEKGKSK